MKGDDSSACRLGYGLLVLVFQKGVGTDLLGYWVVDRIEAWKLIAPFRATRGTIPQSEPQRLTPLAMSLGHRAESGGDGRAKPLDRDGDWLWF